MRKRLEAAAEWGFAAWEGEKGKPARAAVRTLGAAAVLLTTAAATTLVMFMMGVILPPIPWALVVAAVFVGTRYCRL